MAYIAGGFTATYEAATIGEVENGFTLEWTARKRLITGDNQGQTPQDAVFQGHELFVSLTLTEWDATKAQALFWPYNAAFGTQGTVGRLDVASSLVKALVLTQVAGPPSGGVDYTFDRVVLAEGFPVSVLFAPDLRVVPLRLRVYPNASGQFFTTA